MIKVPDDLAKSKERLNEVVASILASHVRIEVPDCAVIEVPDGMLTSFKGPVPAGDYFGSLYALDRVPLARDVALCELEAALYPLLAFDLMILNPDRKPGDVLRMTGDDRLANGIMAIDHGNAFGGSAWTMAELDRHDATSETIAPGLSTWIFRDLHDTDAARVAAAVVTRAASGFEKALDKAAQFVDIDADDRAAIERFLKTRIQSLEGLAVAQIARNG